MPRAHPAHPDEFDDVLLLVSPESSSRRAIAARLSRALPRTGGDAPDRHPRFKIVSASTSEQALRCAAAPVTVAAVDLALPRRGGVAVIRLLRVRRPDLAILAFTATAPASEGMAAVMAGADFFYDWGEDQECEGVAHALDVAVDRRRLTQLVERGEAEVEAARSRLAQLSGDLARALPGFRQPHSRDGVLPFREAGRRYLLASARLFEGDARGLAAALGVSYFALRRLLARYEVPFPRSRK